MMNLEDRRIRHVLRAATTDDHLRVDASFSHFSLASPKSYRSFLRAHARALGAIEPAARPYASRLTLLADDLAVLGDRMPDSAPWTMEEGEGFRWGLLYTLEGSRLGGAMLARRVGPGLPHRYLSAAHEKGEWVAFQHALDVAAMRADEDWVDAAVRGASTAFALFADAARVEQAVTHG
ncbi:MAG: biliverdin-producing heme oxygenase [bacterium]|nr:biliverdin-producing heme oxygenase [bacterium]